MNMSMIMIMIMNKVNPTKGDSPKLAGVMDLLIAKGVWFRAVRCSERDEWGQH